MKGLTPVLLTALSIGIFIFYIQPQYEEIGNLRVEEDRYNDAVDASERLEQLRDDLLDTYNNFSTADRRRIAKFLPQQIDDVRLILDINTLAEDNAIDIESIDLVEKEERNGNAQVASADAQTLAEQVQADFQTLTLNFAFDATYGQFIDFITDLESSLRIIDITALTFAVSEENPSQYTFDITLETYWLK